MGTRQLLLVFYALLAMAVVLFAARMPDATEQTYEAMQPSLRAVAARLPPDAFIDLYGSGTPGELLMWTRFQLSPRTVEPLRLTDLHPRDTLLLVHGLAAGPDSLMQALLQQSDLLFDRADAQYRYLLIHRPQHAAP